MHKPLAALVAVVIVLALILGGGYLASRQLYFIGTNSQGIVTIYRGFPYDLPAGVHLYETYVVSGVPSSLVPPDRRSHWPVDFVIEVRYELRGSALRADICIENPDRVVPELAVLMTVPKLLKIMPPSTFKL